MKKMIRVFEPTRLDKKITRERFIQQQAAKIARFKNIYPHDIELRFSEVDS
jgi:hypothetical protein